MLKVKTYYKILPVVILIALIAGIIAFNKDKFKISSKPGLSNIAGANISSSTSSTFSQEISTSTATSSYSEPANVDIEYKSWIAYWDQQSAYDTIANNPSSLNSISPSIYALNADGTIKLKSTLNQNLVNIAGQNNIEFIPSISNSDNGSLSSILNNPSLLNKNIDTIVYETLTKNYDGFDIDYEAIKAADKDAFTNYIKLLSEKLHTNNKKLTIAILWKAEPAEIIDEFSESRKAQDWGEIGKYVDEFRIMAYDYTHSYNTQGPVAPSHWIEEIIKYALSKVPKEKIILGLPLYAYEWTEGKEGAKALLWEDIYNLKTKYPDSIISEELIKGEKKLIYNSGSSRQVIWYQDAEITKLRAELANSYSIDKIIFWRLGGEDPEIWTY